MVTASGPGQCGLLHARAHETAISPAAPRGRPRGADLTQIDCAAQRDTRPAEALAEPVCKPRPNRPFPFTDCQDLALRLAAQPNVRP